MEENETNSLFDSLPKWVQERVEESVTNNGKAVSAGAGGLVAYASAGAIGAEIAVAVGLTAGAAPLIAIGLGYITYQTGTGLCNYAMREYFHKGSQNNNSDDSGN